MTILMSKKTAIAASSLFFKNIFSIFAHYFMAAALSEERNIFIPNVLFYSSESYQHTFATLSSHLNMFELELCSSGQGEKGIFLVSKREGRKKQYNDVRKQGGKT